MIENQVLLIRLQPLLKNEKNLRILKMTSVMRKKAMKKTQIIMRKKN